MPEYSQYDYNMYGALGYDAIWTIALTLQKASDVLQLRRRGAVNNETKRLEAFTYDDTELKDLFFQEMANVHFIGVSVSIDAIIFLIFLSFLKNDEPSILCYNRFPRTSWQHQWSKFDDEFSCCCYRVP